MKKMKRRSRIWVRTICLAVGFMLVPDSHLLANRESEVSVPFHNEVSAFSPLEPIYMNFENSKIAFFDASRPFVSNQMLFATDANTITLPGDPTAEDPIGVIPLDGGLWVLLLAVLVYVVIKWRIYLARHNE